jgi:DNA-binding transcriptional LysR family regulator
VESGSFTAAADRLEVAKSAISRRVSALEERLGVQLLRRTTRRLSITESGRAFYEQSVRILADLDEAESALRQQHGRLHGVLRVALPLTFGIKHMCKPIADFVAMHPDVSFDLDLNDRRVDLVQEGLDVALRIGRLRDSSMIARRLFGVRSVVCASPAYLDRHGEPETPDELARHDCLVYSNLPEPDLWVCHDADGRRVRTRVKVLMKSSSGDFLCSSAENGLGIAVQPTFIVGDSIRRGDLVPILTGYRWPESPAYAVYPPTRHLSHRVRTFIDFLADRFAGVPYWDEDCDRVLSARQT